MSREKGFRKCEKINERSFNKVSFSSKKSKNAVVYGSLRFLAIRVAETGAILGQSEAFETKYIEFLYKAIVSQLFFPNKQIF